MNPLKELFGFNKNNKISRKEFLEQRRMLKSKFIWRLTFVYVLVKISSLH